MRANYKNVGFVAGRIAKATEKGVGASKKSRCTVAYYFFFGFFLVLAFFFAATSLMQGSTI
jgi:hypothetical protein